MSYHKLSCWHLAISCGVNQTVGTSGLIWLRFIGRDNKKHIFWMSVHVRRQCTYASFTRTWSTNTCAKSRAVISIIRGGGHGIDLTRSNIYFCPQPVIKNDFPVPKNLWISISSNITGSSSNMTMQTSILARYVCRSAAMVPRPDVNSNNLWHHCQCLLTTRGYSGRMREDGSPCFVTAA